MNAFDVEQLPMTDF